MLALIFYLLPWIMAQGILKPYIKKNMNWLEISGMINIVIYLLIELNLSTNQHYDNVQYRRITPWVWTIGLVVVPTVIYVVYTLHVVKREVLDAAYYRSHRLFKLLSCGCVSTQEYREAKVAPIEK